MSQDVDRELDFADYEDAEEQLNSAINNKNIIHIECQNCGDDNVETISFDNPMNAFKSLGMDGWVFNGFYSLCPDCVEEKVKFK